MRETTETTIVRIAALGLALGMLLSPALWSLTDREAFPLLPLLGKAHKDVVGIWPGILGLCAAVAPAIFPRKKILPATAILCFSALCALDLTRLQPWVWFYLLVFLMSLTNATSGQMRWLLAGVYVWSGFSKITPYFAEDNFSWFCEAFSFTQALGKLPVLGYAMAVAELALGLGLIWQKTRQLAGYGIVALHLLILVFLVKMQWNSVVIPWNIAMATMVWLLAKREQPFSETTLKTSKLYAQWAIPALFGWVCPALYFIGLWPHNLSWRLYSNTQPEATFFSGKNNMTQTVEMDQVWEKYAFDNKTKLLLDDWAYGALGVPMFATDRTFQQIGRYLCQCDTGPSETSGMYLLTVDQWDKAKERMKIVGCATLTEGN